MYITLTDFQGQRYIATVPDKDPATAASIAVSVTPEVALIRLREKIVHGEPIACEIIHSNNRSETLTIFHGPVTLSHYG